MQQESMQQQMLTMRARLEEQALKNSLRAADSAYLEQQLREKEDALEECLTVVDLVEKKHQKVAEANHSLTEENSRLQEENRRLMALLKMKNQLRGVPPRFNAAHEETY